MSANRFIINLEKVNFTYNKGKTNEFHVLKDIVLRIKEGEFAIIFGSSGCGKSTLLNVISGFEKPQSGNVLVDGKEVSNLNESEKTDFHRTRMGIIFQAYNLIGSLNVMDNVILPQMFINEDRGRSKERANKLLKTVDLEKQAHKLPSQLSGGQQQRVGIARSMINNPPLILADEPVGNLDSKSANAAMELLAKLNKEEKKTILLVSHNPKSRMWGNHIIYMKDGQIEKEEYKDIEEEKATKDGKVIEVETSGLDRILYELRGLSRDQINVLMLPMKARLLAESFLITYEEHQIKTLEKNIERRLDGIINSKELLEQLDKDLEQGGVGLDLRVARTLWERIENINHLAKSIAKEEDNDKKALLITRFLVKQEGAHFSKDDERIISSLIEKRLSERITYNQFRGLLDAPQDKGGVGLDKRVVRNLLVKIDLILVVAYGIESKKNNHKREVIN